MPTIRPADRMTTHRGLARGRRRRDFLHCQASPWLRRAAHTTAHAEDPTSASISQACHDISHARACARMPRRRRSSSTMAPPASLERRGRSARCARAARRCGKGCSGRAARALRAGASDADGAPTIGIARAPRAQPGQHVEVVVAVDDELGAVPRQHRFAARPHPRRPRERLAWPGSGGWWISTRRKTLGAAQALEHRAEPRAAARLPTRPEAISGGVGTAELTPIERHAVRACARRESRLAGAGDARPLARTEAM